MQTIKRMSADAVDKFVAENGGECMDFADGALLDNVVYSFPFGTLFCFEQYQTEWSSNYTLFFFHKDRDRGINKMWDKFYTLKGVE